MGYSAVCWLQRLHGPVSRRAGEPCPAARPLVQSERQLAHLRRPEAAAAGGRLVPSRGLALQAGAPAAAYANAARVAGGLPANLGRAVVHRGEPGVARQLGAVVRRGTLGAERQAAENGAGARATHVPGAGAASGGRRRADGVHETDKLRRLRRFGGALAGEHQLVGEDTRRRGHRPDSVAGYAGGDRVRRPVDEGRGGSGGAATVERACRAANAQARHRAMLVCSSGAVCMKHHWPSYR